MRVLLIDDHPMVFDAFRSLLERQPVHVRLECLTSLGEAVQRLRQAPPVDHIFLDLTLPGHAGVSALNELQHEYPHIPVTVLAADHDQALIDDCLLAGVRGFLPKTLDRRQIISGLARLLRGETFVASPASTDVHFANPAQAVAERFGLTARQLDVLCHLVQGKSNREIAQALDQSVNTTQVHVSAVLQAVGAANRTEAVTIAARYGLLAP